MRRRLFSLALVFVALTATPASSAVNDPARDRQWGLDRIGAEEAWRVANGAGVTVAVIDTGVDLKHEDFAGQLVPGRDFVDNDDDPQDAEGHGTHVAGIVAAAANNGRGVAGVAPGAKIMPVRVLDAGGSGELSDVINGIRWAIAHGAKVINLSMSEDTQAFFGSDLADVLTEAWNAGVIPVVAAGNQFIADSGFNDEPVVVVSSTNRSDGKPTYSSGVGNARWGLAAPGGELPDLGRDGAILSTYWTGDDPSEYAYLAGTSQAAPMVSGALAVLLSTGRFTPEQAVRRVLDTAKDVGPTGNDGTFGAGRLDLAAAMRGVTAASSTTAVTEPSTTAPAPTTSPSTTVAPTTAPSRPSDTSAVAAPPALVPAATEDGEEDDDRPPVALVAGAVLLLGAVLAAGIRARRG